MLDDLREQAGDTSYDEFEDDNEALFENFDDADGDGGKSKRKGGRAKSKHFLGMTPIQRFIIALMLLVVICVSAGFLLIVTGRIVP